MLAPPSMENLNDMGISQIRKKLGMYTNLAQIFHSFKNIIKKI